MTKSKLRRLAYYEPLDDFQLEGVMEAATQVLGETADGDQRAFYRGVRSMAVECLRWRRTAKKAVAGDYEGAEEERK